MHIPTLTTGQLHDTAADVLVRMLEHLVQEPVETFAEQLPQAIVSHRLMQQRLLHILNAAMIRYHYRYPARAARIKTFRTALPAL